MLGPERLRNSNVVYVPRFLWASPQKIEDGFDSVFLDCSCQRRLIQLRGAIELLLNNNMDITEQLQGAAINTNRPRDSAEGDPTGCCRSADGPRSFQSGSVRLNHTQIICCKRDRTFHI